MNMEPDLAGKITGMLLEMSEGDVIGIIEDKMACQEKVCPRWHRHWHLSIHAGLSFGAVTDVVLTVCSGNLCLQGWARVNVPTVMLFVTRY